MGRRAGRQDRAVRIHDTDIHSNDRGRGLYSTAGNEAVRIARRTTTVVALDLVERRVRY
jgi:hypothetical protein